MVRCSQLISFHDPINKTRQARPDECEYEAANNVIHFFQYLNRECVLPINESCINTAKNRFRNCVRLDPTKRFPFPDIEIAEI